MKQQKVNPLTITFPVGVISNEVFTNIAHLQKMLREKRSFYLAFEDLSSATVCVTTCSGPCKDLFIPMKKHSKDIEFKIALFNAAVATLKVDLDLEVSNKDNVLKLLLLPESKEVKESITNTWKTINIS